MRKLSRGPGLCLISSFHIYQSSSHTMTYCVKSPFVHTLAIIKIVLIVQGLEIVSPAARRVISVRVNTFPTTSCRIPGLNLPVTLIQCLFSCLSTFDLLHTFSQNVNTRECLCCKDPPSGTIHSFPGWISFSLSACEHVLSF